MSASSTATAMLGILIQFKSEKYEAQVNRFDPKTGKPVVLKSPALKLTAFFDGKEYVLPEDDIYFSEDANRYNFDMWSFDRIGIRQRLWFESLDILSKDELLDPDSKEIQYFRKYYIWENRPVGIKIADTDSFKEFSVENNIPVKTEIARRLLPIFGNADYTPKFYLISELHS